MPEVTGYSVVVYGGPDGYQANRSQIELRGSNGDAVAWVRFKDPGMTFEADYTDGGIIHMHLPSTMFQSILDILRNEKQLNVYFASDRGFLGT